MQRRNRVDPFGNLIATPARGTLMGNRGCLHDDNGRLIKVWARLPWVTCVLDYKGRHRQIMAPGKYTELFFLDEATALSAGHRPCGTCQKARYEEFKRLWLATNATGRHTAANSIADIDAFIHAERYASAGEKAVWKAAIGELPEGVVYLRSSDPNQPWLKWQGAMQQWSPEGYSHAEPLDDKEPVRVITPKSIVRTLTAGFKPRVHPSAGGAIQRR